MLSSNLLRNLFKSSEPGAINDPFKIEHRMQCGGRELHVTPILNCIF